MGTQKTIEELIGLFDSIISKNRSSFSLEECNVLECVKMKLELLYKQATHYNKTQKRAIIQTLVTELLKILLDPKVWNNIKNIF